ncbi:hypothetical protein [Bacillus mobilis]|uniref:hypothetical protein n=1 Tax=Bacillus mobilis TaxID=2026190 RepID=UPI00367047C7
MFYNNQPPYPQQPFYPQQQDQRYTEQYEEQEQQYEQNAYDTRPNYEYPQNPYAAPQNQEQQYQQNPYATQPQMYQPNYGARVSPPAPQTIDPTQPQILPPGPIIDPTQPQILPPGPTFDITQPQILPPGPITEPTQQQIQQVVGTQFLPLKKPVLDFVKPWVDYGLNEAKHTSHKHALTEVAAIMFLVGKGFNPTIAHYIVESWEKNEQF